MNETDKNTITEAARTMAALLDLVQGFACEAGVEALERYAHDPIGLMDRATAALGNLKDLAGEKREDEKK
jgi:hypothetical protein